MLDDEKANDIICVFCNLKFSKDSKEHINYGKWNLYSVSEKYANMRVKIFSVYHIKHI